MFIFSTTTISFRCSFLDIMTCFFLHVNIYTYVFIADQLGDTPHVTQNQLQIFWNKAIKIKSTIARISPHHHKNTNPKFVQITYLKAPHEQTTVKYPSRRSKKNSTRKNKHNNHELQLRSWITNDIHTSIHSF